VSLTNIDKVKRPVYFLVNWHLSGSVRSNATPPLEGIMWKKAARFFLGHIQTKLTGTIILANTFVLAVYGYYDYHEAKIKAENGLKELSQTLPKKLAESLSVSIYNIDYATVDKVLEAEMIDNRIAAIDIIESDGKIVISRKGRDKEWKIVNLTEPVIGEYLFAVSGNITKNNENMAICTVYLTEKFDKLELKNVLIRVVNTIAILDISLLFVLIIALRYGITKPIVTAISIIEQIEWEETSHEISKDLLGRMDEIGTLLSSIKAMQEKLEKSRLDTEKATQALITSQSQLRQAQKMEAIGTLAGGIAHDFNNILTAILGNIQLMQRSVGKTLGFNESKNESFSENSRKDSDLTIKVSTMVKFSEYLEVCFNASKRAAELVRQILTFSRKSESKKAATNIVPIIKEALKLLRASLPTTIDMNIELSSKEILVVADLTQIHQVIMNLCTNAGHAMPDGGKLSVTLEMIWLDSQQEKCLTLPSWFYGRLTVADTGIGMTPEVLERIFDPYFTTKAPGSGTGLGLSVVHGIVTDTGGAITVSSQLGKGSIFTIWLPITSRKCDEKEKFEPLDSQSLTKKIIMVVDDEKPAANAMRYNLEDEGFTVDVYTDSFEALGAFWDNPRRYGLVITDLTMPKMTGLVFAKEILKTLNNFPIILVTGSPEQFIEQKAKEIGIKAVIAKPYLIQDLLSIIQKELTQSVCEDHSFQDPRPK
jgi:signal transduction histidine kinase/CheY-like chemotaxis protein